LPELATCYVLSELPKLTNLKITKLGNSGMQKVTKIGLAFYTWKIVLFTVINLCVENYQYYFPTRSAGQKPYIMPVGGSNLTGMWGYIEAFRELLDQVNVMHVQGGVSCISKQKIAQLHSYEKIMPCFLA